MKRLTMKCTALGMALLISSPSILAADYTQHWAKDAITKWNTYEVVKGYKNGDFRPNHMITRAELATILDRIFKFPETTNLSPYMDIIASPDKWYVIPVSKVTALELMHIQGFLFEPNAPVTREEAAYAIAKAYELLPIVEEKTYFKDEDKVSSWAKEVVKTLAHYNYINGTPEGNFMPQSTLTRAEIVTMLNNMTSILVTKSEVLTQSIKGNVVINSKEATLKNMTIEGNLYLTSAVEKSVLDNVTVKGTVYVRGGSLKLSGIYEEVQLATGASVELTAGTINKLVVTKAGSSLKVAEGTSVKELVQKTPIQIEGQGTIAGQNTILGQGGIGGGQMPQNPVVKLDSVEIFINGVATELPISDKTILIDIPSLSQSFSTSDTIDGFRMSATVPGVTITSSTGSIQAGNMYSFRELENELGLIREIATEAGMPAGLVIEQLLGEDRVTIGSLLDNYALGKILASSLGFNLQDNYTFERTLTNNQGGQESIYITLRLQ